MFHYNAIYGMFHYNAIYGMFFHRDTFWPNGVLAESRPPRDFNTKMRTRVVAKTKLLSTMSGTYNRLFIVSFKERPLLSLTPIFVCFNTFVFRVEGYPKKNTQYFWTSEWTLYIFFQTNYGI